MNYIFVNADDYRNGKIDNSILIHETTHAKQKHTLDVIFTELLIAFFWFNPILYLYKSKIKQNHEFIADKAATGNNADIKQYQMLLINSIAQRANIKLASNFNYLITKKRLIMMTKTTSKFAGICRQIAIIPVFFAAICIFSSKSIAQNVPKTVPQQKSGSVESNSTKEKSNVTDAKKESKNVNSKVQNANTNEAVPFALAETKPKFQGGDQNTFNKWVIKQIRYPETAVKAGIQGKVIVQFSVDTDGQVKDVQVLKKVHPDIDAEAVRVIKSSPAWTPGKQKNKPVKIVFLYPVNFQLDDDNKDLSKNGSENAMSTVTSGNDSNAGNGISNDATIVRYQIEGDSAAVQQLQQQLNNHNFNNGSIKIDGNITIKQVSLDENVPSHVKDNLAFKDVDIQSVFTPNGDGQNDAFKFIEGNKHTMNTIKIQIYNRWGTKIYSYNGDYKTWEGWNGKIINDNEVEVNCLSGNYFYVVSGLGWNDAALDGKSYHGKITLNR